MNFKKIAAGAIVSALAVSTMAVSASANIYPIPEELRDPALGTDGNWLIQLYNVGNPAENKPTITDRDLDLQAINNFIFYVELVPYPDLDLGFPLEMYDVSIDGFGGNVIYSANGGTIGSAAESDMYDEDNGVTLFGKYNWPNGNTWWGFPEKDDTYEGRQTEFGGEGTNQGTVDYVNQRLAMEYVNTFAYRLELDIAKEYGESDPDYIWPEGGECYQVGLQEWGNDPAYGVKVDLMILKDVDGNFLMAFNEFGEEITEEAANEKIEWLETREVDLTAGPEADPLHSLEAPADESGDSSEPAGGDNSGSGSDNASNDGDSASTTTTAPSSSNNSSNNTMLFVIIGIVAVVVIVVIVVIVVVTKKKKS